MLDALIPAIQDHTLSPQDRYGIQADVYALARAGHVDYVDYFQLLRQAYKYEENFTVWKSIIRSLNEINSILNYATLCDSKSLFQSFVRELLAVIYNKLDWDPMPNEGTQTAMLRSLVLMQMGLNEHGRVRDEARRRFVRLFESETNYRSINANIRAAIYLTVAKTGDQQTFEQLKTVGVRV
jgi:hypothetical protein